MLRIMCCGRPCFERLLQLIKRKGAIVNVVEDLVLKGYYNSFVIIILLCFVVEDLVLKGYYNQFWMPHGKQYVVEDLVLKGYYNQKKQLTII